MEHSGNQGPYQELFTEHEIAVFRESGHGGRMGFGERCALLIVDVSINFCGDRSEPVLDSIKRWKFSCGSVAWDAAESIVRLRAAARVAGVPVIYTTGPFTSLSSIGPGRWADKSSESMSREQVEAGQQIIDPLTPAADETVIHKEKPSAFFGTPLASMLMDAGIDSVIVCGTTTSGCIRATVVDAFSYNLKVAVVAEATFDRSELSHKVSLFDLHQKYADVLSESEVVDRLALSM